MVTPRPPETIESSAPPAATTPVPAEPARVATVVAHPETPAAAIEAVRAAAPAPTAPAVELVVSPAQAEPAVAVAIEPEPVVAERKPLESASAPSGAVPAFAASQATITSSAVGRESDVHSLVPSHLDSSPAIDAEAFRPRRPWRVLLAAAGVVAAIVLGLAIRSRSSDAVDGASAVAPHPTQTQAARARPAPPPAATPAPTPEAPAPSAAPATPSATDGDATSVTVHVSPAGAVLFRHGERLGIDEVTVEVPRGGRMTLVAQLDGYLPRSVVIDTSTKHVNIVLSRPLPTGGKVARSPTSSGAAAEAAAVYPDPATPSQSPSEGHAASAPTAAPPSEKPAAPAAPAPSARQWEPKDDLSPL
jgi:hypothetical protein